MLSSPGKSTSSEENVGIDREKTIHARIQIDVTSKCVQKSIYKFK